jgi:hypothetical protein
MDELEEMKRRWMWCFHLGVFILVCILAAPYYTRPRPYGPLDYAILPFHEAGHFIFAIFGQFMSVLGGTLVQLGLPMAFALYFLLARRDLFAGAASAFWFFENFINISVYMRDARFMLLPLFGGDEHDWNFIFGRLHLLNRSVAIADAVKVAGLIGMTAAIACMLIWLVRSWPDRRNPTGSRIHRLISPQNTESTQRKDSSVAGSYKWLTRHANSEGALTPPSPPPAARRGSV